MAGKLTPDVTKGLLLGCREKYGGCPINLPIDAENIGPWVKVSLNAKGEGELTVGNESCPSCDPLHTATIKSFEYGSSDGFIVKLVIHDQAGGSFSRFAEAMNTDFTKMTSDYVGTVTWGWTGVKCNNDSILVESEPVTFLISSLSASMSAGKIVYEMEGTDLWRGVMQSRAYKTIGDSNNTVKLKEAIRQLFSQKPEPLITNVLFKRRLPDGTVEDWEFKEEPEDSWEPANRSKISVALDWLKNYVTDQDKGMIDYTWGAGESVPTIIFWEDMSCRKVTCSQIGTYIVNGGNLSPVVDFQPKFQWNYTHLGRSGGQPGGGLTPGNGEGDRAKDWQSKCKAVAEKGAGIQMGGASFQNPDAPRNVGMDSNALREANKAQSANAKARTPLALPVKADLVVQGDPTVVVTETIYKNHLSIIVINPFYLTGQKNSGSSSCPDWTIKPPCNDLASNKKWQIQGVNHSIKEGSYLTTYKLFLDAPGVDKPVGEPLGDDGKVLN